MNKDKLSKLILEEKKKRDVAILAHTYQNPEIIDIADITGDSFALSAAAEKLSQKTVIMCGVRFMAETVKMLSPEKTVILANKYAGCPMAEQMDVSEIKAYKENFPDHLVVAYINTSAELKAVSDVCVTSSSAVKIINKLDAKEILFIPDKNLGTYVASQVPEKSIHTLDGCCPVHDQISKEDVLAMKKTYPNAKFAVHPECNLEVLNLADFVGSTSAIIDYCNRTDGQIIVGTERGVVDYLKIKNPNKELIQLKPNKLVCEDMKKTTLEDVYSAVIGNDPYIVEMDESLRIKAKKPIDIMLKYGE